MTLAQVRICVVALAACVLPAHAAGIANALDTRIPVAPEARLGKLENGLSYYIRKNALPEKQLELRLVVKAGSMQEDEDQLGLAHFTEHMAFNGSRHFRKNELVSWLQSIGVKFGADLNAYTNFDDTIYLLPLPTGDKANVEKGFQVLEDWAHGLSLNEDDIDAERGVVLEESRLGKGPGQRMGRVLLPRLLNGSRYASRLPIGKDEVLRSFKPEALRRFYRDWYRPELMAVIAVGDIEPDEAERLIARHFGGLKNPARPRERVETPLAPQSKSGAVVATDPEAGNNTLALCYPTQLRKPPRTHGEYREHLLQLLFLGVLGERLAGRTGGAAPPFLEPDTGFTQLVGDYVNFQVSAMPGQDGAAATLAALVQEVERLRRFGVNEQELARFKKIYLGQMERADAERDKAWSAGYAQGFVAHFLHQEPLAGAAYQLKLTAELFPGITLEEVNRTARRILEPSQARLLMYAGGEEKPVPSAAQLLAALEAAQKDKVEAQESRPLPASLMAARPSGGRIANESVNKVPGTTELVLGNGVTVVLRPSDFQNDEVLLGAVRHGGYSLYEGDDYLNAYYASLLIMSMGMGDFAEQDIAKILAGQNATVNFNINELEERIDGASSRRDIESMLQLLHMSMLQPRMEEARFRASVDGWREAMLNPHPDLETYMFNELNAILFHGQPRGLRQTPEDMDKLKLERAHAIFKERMGNAQGLTFYLVGSFDPEQVKPLLASYLGTLPVHALPEQARDHGVRPARGVIKRELRKGMEEQGIVLLTFRGEAPYSMAARTALEALLEVLNIRINEVLREQQSLIYSGYARGWLDELPYQNYGMVLYLPCAPENTAKVIAAIATEVRRLQAQGPEAADLDKVKANWRIGNRHQLRSNGYWLEQLMAARMEKIDPELFLHFEERFEKLSSAELQLAAQRYLDPANYVELTLKPENKAGR
ncbi:pitrilysin family protein [Massilia sp. erpn]|uniref:M16 family metallopeptidase n=1 Tax=Massilia sp. erpn TaxID=2738142 RepID=UPI0021060FF1|nr:M16 family metallopeptidase [Massilia sp. erpn]UTY58788.1 insulinase family protein [Massilia sp. erpn]